MDILYYILIPLIFIVLKKRLQGLFISLKEKNQEAINLEVLLLSLTLVVIVVEIYIVEL